MNYKKIIKTTALLATPPLFFVFLFVPYTWANGEFIVKWFGCGCPKVDQMGNVVCPVFNANDFTALFWTVISICATAFAAFLSKKIPREKIWIRVIYVMAMLLVSLWISAQFCQMMMWK